MSAMKDFRAGHPISRGPARKLDLPPRPDIYLARGGLRRSVQPATLEIIMNPAQHIVSAPSNTDIALVAYRIWENEGRPHGRAIEHWIQAESLLGVMAPARPAPGGKGAKAARQSRYGLVLNDNESASPRKRA